MTTLRARIADTLHDNGCHRDDAAELADALLAVPGIVIVDTEDGSEVLEKAARAIWREAQPMPWQELRFRKMARAALLAAAAAAEGEGT